MTPETIDRLHRLAFENDARLKIRPETFTDTMTRLDFGRSSIFGDIPAASFNTKSRLITIPYEPGTVRDDVTEIAALHEIGHAATIQQPLDVPQRGPVPEWLKREEIAAWQWAISHIRPEHRDLARAQIRWALSTYEIEPHRIEAVVSLI